MCLLFSGASVSAPDPGAGRSSTFPSPADSSPAPGDARGRRRRRRGGVGGVWRVASQISREDADTGERGGEICMGDGGGLAEPAGEEMVGAREMRWRVFVRAERESWGVEGGEGIVGRKRRMSKESEATDGSEAGF